MMRPDQPPITPAEYDEANQWVTGFVTAIGEALDADQWDLTNSYLNEVGFLLQRGIEGFTPDQSAAMCDNIRLVGLRLSALAQLLHQAFAYPAAAIAHLGGADEAIAAFNVDHVRRSMLLALAENIQNP